MTFSPSPIAELAHILRLSCASLSRRDALDAARFLLACPLDRFASHISDGHLRDTVMVRCMAVLHRGPTPTSA